MHTQPARVTVAALAAAAGAITLTACGAGTPQPTGAPPLSETPAFSQPTPAPTPTPALAKPKVVLDADMSGAESTGDFTVTGRYELSYTYDCPYKSNFALEIRDASGMMVALPVNTIGASGSDTLSKRMPTFSPGPYHIKSFFSGCDWNVKVTDLPDTGGAW